MVQSHDRFIWFRFILGSKTHTASNRPKKALGASEDGTAAIEFALTAPVLILMLFGMIIYAVFFGTAHSVQELAADSARVAIAGLDDTERQRLVHDYLANNAKGYMFIDPSKVSYSAGTSAADANQLAVSVTYDSTQFPLWTLLPSYLLPDLKITRQASIRMGGI